MKCSLPKADSGTLQNDYGKNEFVIYSHIRQNSHDGQVVSRNSKQRRGVEPLDILLDSDTYNNVRLDGADNDQMLEINRGVDNSARRIVRDTISDVYGFPEDRIESGAGKKTPREEGKANERGDCQVGSGYWQ